MQVTIADLLSYVWRKVPQSAQSEYQRPQHPDGQLSGNFPIALLLGGEGTPTGKSLPDPLDPLPAAAKEPKSSSVFDQRGQTVNGPQTNIGGEVTGPIFSGNFQGPVRFESGRQIQVGDITGSTGIAIGDGARATVTQTSSTDIQAIAKAFATILKQVDKLGDDDQKEDAKDALKKLEEEAKKGELTDEGRMRKWLDFLAGMSPDIFDVAVATFTNPFSGLSTTFRKIAERAKEEREAKGKHER